MSSPCSLSIIQFFYLSAHFWLNAMNFTVWKGLRSMRLNEGAPGGGGGGGVPSYMSRAFLACAAYSWLVPLTMSAITLVLQVAYPFMPLTTVPHTHTH